MSNKMEVNKMKVWKDIKIPAAFYDQIHEVIERKHEYNSVSDFMRIASMKELDRLKEASK